MSDQILTFSDLQRLCRPGESRSRPSASTVEAWASRQGLRYLRDGQGGIFTTLQAINAAMGLSEPPDGTRPLTASDVFG